MPRYFFLPCNLDSSIFFKRLVWQFRQTHYNYRSANVAYPGELNHHSPRYRLMNNPINIIASANIIWICRIYRYLVSILTSPTRVADVGILMVGDHCLPEVTAISTWHNEVSLLFPFCRKRPCCNAISPFLDAKAKFVLGCRNSLIVSYRHNLLRYQLIVNKEIIRGIMSRPPTA